MIPQRSHALDAGYDLACLDAFELAPGERATIGTGIAIALAPQTAGLIVPRSGLAARWGITVVNAPGLIDPNYRGEIKVVLLNSDSSSSFQAQAGDRIAQLLMVPFLAPDIISTDKLPEAPDERDLGGFGSSDVKN
jgi:dUTP pyrophosphatase